MKLMKVFTITLEVKHIYAVHKDTHMHKLSVTAFILHYDLCMCSLEIIPFMHSVELFFLL